MYDWQMLGLGSQGSVRSTQTLGRRPDDFMLAAGDDNFAATCHLGMRLGANTKPRYRRPSKMH